MRCKAVRLHFIGGVGKWTTMPCVVAGWFHFKHKDAFGVCWYGRVGN